VDDARVQPTRLQILAAKAQVELNKRTSRASPSWLVDLASRDPSDAPATASRQAQPTPSTAFEVGDVETGRLGTRVLGKLPGRPMQGRDVLALQRQLLDLGYYEVGALDGVFGAKTELAVRKFQTDYNVDNDGVCGRVTKRVLDYLYAHGINKANPPTTAQRNLINFVVQPQRKGLLVIDLISDTDPAGQAHDALAGLLVSQLGELLFHQIDKITGMQPRIVDHADFTPDPELIADYANTASTEMFISLSVANSPSEGPGCAVFYFGHSENVYSHVGRPLAFSIHRKLMTVRGAADRGVHYEESELFERVTAPTVRVQFGNIASSDDRVRLARAGYLDRLSVAIAVGIRDFYLLDQQDGEQPPPPAPAEPRL
jgi:N-acetylmuramoyl-L-alanine amidase